MRFTPLAACLMLLPTLASTLSARANDGGMVTPKAEQIGEVFCLSRTGNDEALITGILSPDLSAIIGDAQSRSDIWARAHPDEKPPLGDGVPWQSAPDYAATCKVGLATLMKSDARVELTYAFPEAPEAGFTDTLILKRIDTGSGNFWRIDNVLYPDGTDLRQALVTMFEGYE